MMRVIIYNKQRYIVLTCRETRCRKEILIRADDYRDASLYDPWLCNECRKKKNIPASPAIPQEEAAAILKWEEHQKRGLPAGWQIQTAEGAA